MVGVEVFVGFWGLCWVLGVWGAIFFGEGEKFEEFCIFPSASQEERPAQCGHPANDVAANDVAGTRT